MTRNPARMQYDNLLIDMDLSPAGTVFAACRFL
jgi:hypothetical protein